MAHQTRSARKAGLFDLRWIIAVLFGIYGVVLIVLGVGFRTDEDLAKAGGININLWSGVGMAALAAVFGLWAAWRPMVVPERVEEMPPADDAAGAGER
ncbi:hypothetical protein F0L68_21150 [Solihabitans fulvus]|uniref:Uncharacterized protein n=1 Tax=Solihabitans fulvus TaxID=1892852 RepID=A0A5B2X7G4_9PSEU|nr:hypothetical protein [Solihabitans fulvus]KAA2259448.1 hypothetical protein F0L68_21150 [Solihabitans fulvus]